MHFTNYSDFDTVIGTLKEVYMKNILVILLVVAVLGGGYYVMSSKKTNSSVPTDTQMEKTTEPVAEAMESGAVKEFTVDSFEMGFSVKTISVKKGDTVKITLTNSGKYTHDWAVDEFSARTKVIKNGETDSVTFVADKAGTYEYYCGVMTHRQQGMVGKLIVE